MIKTDGKSRVFAAWILVICSFAQERSKRTLVESARLDSSHHLRYRNDRFRPGRSFLLRRTRYASSVSPDLALTSVSLANSARVK